MTRRTPVKNNERARAAQFVDQILQDPNRTIDRVLGERNADVAKAVTPLERELVAGVLRRYFTLQHLVSSFLTKPLRDKDHDLFCLLLVGAYQLHYTHLPDHAAVNETVSAVPVLRKPWARGLVNGVMRNMSRAKASKESHPDASQSTLLIEAEQSFGEAVLDTPRWLADLVLSQYEEGEELLQAMLERAPMCLRINQAKINPGSYAGELQTAFSPLWFDESIVLEQAMPQTSLPGYAQGLVSVQDGGAQFAAHLLDVPDGGRWLDACAAPGGKLFHGMELHPTATAVAVEVSEPRARSIQTQAKRLGHSSHILHTADALEDYWWDGVLFDAILIDAPCSGTGTLRRNPDIKHHRTMAQIEQLTQLQLELVTKLWSLVKPGGSLLYCTCSILAQENDEIISSFLSSQADAQLVAFTLPTGKATELGWQLLPIDPNTDGFYYAKLIKEAL